MASLYPAAPAQFFRIAHRAPGWATQFGWELIVLTFDTLRWYTAIARVRRSRLTTPAQVFLIAHRAPGWATQFGWELIILPFELL